ncbi:SDR family NAD(P)-dependent oxidoreductase [Roseibium sp.]|uniref:SDR family NAD(P)-dependent oxidoreductase n=1 Tax=Roseibium sp. TaxID=1936156 RepID=UPI003A976D9C
MTSSSYVAAPDDGCAWITGASSGIGRSLALSLARDGWTVVATARSSDKLDTLCAEASGFSGRIVPVPGDVTDAESMISSCDDIVRDLGVPALLVANAGVYHPQDGLAGNPEEWRQTIAVNLNGTVNVLLPVISRMKEQGRGQIAIVSSVAGYRGLPTSAAYGATKAGLINMAEALKFDLDRANIRIQVVNPGFVDTPATRGNPFPMPDLMTVDEAVVEFRKGLNDPKRFEIAFPKAFVRKMKLLRLLPYRWFFPVLAKATGWDRKTD